MLFRSYHHSAQPFQLDAARYEMVSLGEELIAPFVRPDAQGDPLFRLPGRPGALLPYLGYAPGAYLGQMVDLILKQSSTAIHFDRVYETDMAEGLKAMALEGHGIAFLPFSAVKKEIRARRLVSAAPSDMPALHITMDVRAYREKPVSHDARPSPARSARVAAVTPKTRTLATKSSAQALWDYLSLPAVATPAP